ncbi:MAG: hypothetical protein ABI594_16735 [Ginsengibacter sp.]
MQRKFFLLSLIATLICNVSFAKIWRVNNTAGIVADFTTAQAAHDAAATGDTIHLEPSVTSYGILTTTKKLTWISTGNFLASHLGLQYSSTPGTMDGVTANPGSDNSVFSCNAQYFQCYAPNVTFLRCFVATNYIYILAPANNCAIIDCYINGYIYVQGSTNTIINNNIITFDISLDATSSAVIVNNVMNTLGGGGSSISNSQFQNNIIDQSTSPYIFINSNINNNIANNASLPAGNGNQNNVDMNTVFVNYQGTTDGDFVLKAGGGNPAIGTGFGGIDMGAFSGTTAFVLGLQPAIPAIYQINAPAAPAGNTMTVTFSTKSNN